MKVEGKSIHLYSSLYLLGILAMSYFVPRTSFHLTLGIFSGCFLLYCLLYKVSSKGKTWKYLLFLAAVLRLALFFSLPQWSEDYARFLWDGQLIAEGHNPYTLTPTEAREQLDFRSGSFMEELFALMNSPDYNSVYPPSNQVVFALAAFLGKEDTLVGVMIIRGVLLVFEMLTFYLIYLLLRLLRQPSNKLLLYALNPLVIMEITGNLHFEGMMLTMILGGIYFIEKKKYFHSGGLMAAAVAVKLSPLMLFPVFFRRIPKNAWLGFSLAALFVLLLTLSPLLWNVEGFGKSLSLYGNNFEFNASAYYLLRELGTWVFGYNLIGILGPALKGLTLVLIVMISLRCKNSDTRSLLEMLLLIYWVFLLLNTVVHPWYILPAVALSVLTDKKGFILWSFFIVLSYQAYQNPSYAESPWLLLLQYFCVCMALWGDGFYRDVVGIKTKS